MLKQTFYIELKNGSKHTFHMLTTKLDIHRDDVLAYFTKNVVMKDVKDIDVVSLYRVVEQFEPIE